MPKMWDYINMCSKKGWQQAMPGVGSCQQLSSLAALWPALMGRRVGWPLCPHQAVRKAVKPWFIAPPSVINRINKFKTWKSTSMNVILQIVLHHAPWPILDWLPSVRIPSNTSNTYTAWRTTNPKGSKTEIWSPGSHVAEAMSKVSVSKPASCRPKRDLACL